MRYAGLDPDHSLLRWGNFNLTLLLPSTVFEADDTGRSYKLRPNTRSIWLRSLTLGKEVLPFFLVPDGPGLAEAIKGTPAIPVETSRETTNSWGLRGPEPDPEAPAARDRPGRLLHAGDVHRRRGYPPGMPQALSRGPFQGEGLDPEYRRPGVFAGAILYSLLAYVDDFRPQFVIVSVCTNDFGDLHRVPSRGGAIGPRGSTGSRRSSNSARRGNGHT